METSGHSYGWSFSPDRTRLVLGGPGDVWVVDPVRFTLVAKVPSGVKSPPAATVWLGKTLFAVFYSGYVPRSTSSAGKRPARSWSVAASTASHAAVPRS